MERTAFVAMVFVLLLSTGFAINAARSTSTALHQLQHAATLNAAYQEARYDAAMEESLEHKYRLEPSSIVRADYLIARTSLEAAMHNAIAASDPINGDEDAAVLRAHRAYVAATYAMFDAVDADRFDVLKHLDHMTNPVSTFVQKSVEARAAHQRILTDRIFEQINGLHRQIVEKAIFLAVLRLVCFGAYIAIIVIYQRRLGEAHRTELLRLEEAAMIDHLTGVGNHRAYKEDLRRAVSRASRYGERLTLALLDIDEMKIINDQSGHMHGDWVLQALGRQFQTLPVQARAFRLGGDEFGVLLPNTSPDEARNVMEELRKSVQSTIGATISVGIVTLAGVECDDERLQSQADAALYSAKRAGRNTLETFDAAVDEMWRLSPAKVRQLRNLISSDDISIEFQPIWDVETSSILAYEALARPAREYGFGGPQDIFDLAERIGDATEIDAACRRATLRRAKQLPDGILLFVNVVPRSLDHNHLDPLVFADEVIAAGLSPQRVVIEITERSTVQVDVLSKVANELRQLGFRLALDDTGVGNSGLEMLSKLAVDFVKIDRCIIVKALTNRGARGVIAGIIAIAKETGAYVIAEGIEDIPMLDLVCGPNSDKLHQGQVRGVQGHLLRRPSTTMVSPGESHSAKSILRQVMLRKQPFSGQLEKVAFGGSSVVQEDDGGDYEFEAARAR